MARLIDADKFYEELEEIRMDYIDEYSMSSKFAAEVIETVQDEYLRKSPTVDAVEVVRCQFCKYYNSIMGLCCVDRKLGQTIPPVRVQHSDFCSYGKRRDNV